MNFAVKSSIKVSGRELLIRALNALERNLKLEPLPIAGCYSVPVWISSDAHARLEVVASANGIQVQEAAGQLAQAWYIDSLRAGSYSIVKEDPAVRKRRDFKEQLIQGLRENLIVAAEGSTGLGKGRILGEAALDILTTDSKAHVWVSAPTYIVIAQLLTEFGKVPNADGVLDSPVLLLGRQSFVSRTMVESVIEAMRADADIQGDLRSGLSNDEIDTFEKSVTDWLANGAPPRTPGTRSLGKWVVGLSHLFDDYLSFIPEDITSTSHPLRRAWLDNTTTDDEEPAAAIRLDMFDRARNARLVFLTHTMLAWQHMPVIREKSQERKALTKPTTGKRKGAGEDVLELALLNSCSHLLVDECHEIENAFANVFCSTISLKSLRYLLGSLKTTPARQSLCESMDVLMQSLREMKRSVSGMFVTDKVTAQIVQVFDSTIKTLRTAVSRGGDAETASESATWLKDLSYFAAVAKQGVFADFSPKLAYPRLMAGRSSLTDVLKILWNDRKAVGLVSATIFVPRAGGSMDSIYTEIKLGLPQERTRVIGPFIAPWVTSTPILHHPSKELINVFSYPSDDDREEGDESNSESRTSLWQDAVSRAVALAAATSKGGMLVLATSYTDIKALEARLSPVLKNRLIVQQKGIALAKLKETYEQIHAKGWRPVWLATGSAWRGLDLSEGNKTPPEEDMLLSDLVILRAPWNTNQSLTHAARRAYSNGSAEIAETAFQLRQGIGRLIRRCGLLHRRIWLLDGRLWSPKHARTRALLAVIANYKTAEFTKDSISSMEPKFEARAHSKK